MNEGIGCDPLQGQGVNEGLREGGGDDSSYPSHVKSVMSFHFTLERVGETEKGAARIDRVLAARRRSSEFFHLVIV